MAAASATVLSVLLSDGDREIVAGEVVIDAGVTFRKLQFLIGDMVGVSAHQINLYLLRRRSARSGRQPAAAQIRTKTPIGEGTDFAALAREEGCAVVAQLRGKDKQGRGRRDRGGGGGKADPPSGKKRGHPQPEKSAPRRAVGFPVPHGASAASILPVAEESGPVVAGLFQYQLLRELQRQRGRYLPATPAAGHYSGSHGHDEAAAVCEVCSRAAGTKRGAAAASFHWCVRDRVVAEAFRSAAGPIQRPLHSRVKASA